MGKELNNFFHTLTLSCLLTGTHAYALEIKNGSENINKIQNTVQSQPVQPQQPIDSLKGTWYNELGSYIKIINIDGTKISCVYNSAVGNAKNEYPCMGYVDPVPVEFPGNQKTYPISFTVLWKNDFKGNSHSVTAWSGQYQIDGKGDQAIRTTWLLTRATDIPSSWSSTLVGTNIFYKVIPKNLTP